MPPQTGGRGGEQKLPGAPETPDGSEPPLPPSPPSLPPLLQPAAQTTNRTKPSCLVSRVMRETESKRCSVDKLRNSRAGGGVCRDIPVTGMTPASRSPAEDQDLVAAALLRAPDDRQLVAPGRP